MLKFACEKVLARANSMGITGSSEKLGVFASRSTTFPLLTLHVAVLSIRLPLDFNMTTLEGREESFNQVRKHMRLCVKVHDDFDACVTIQPAEPLLAEAAYSIVIGNNLDQAGELLKALEGPSLDKGDRGELVAMLLCLLARDEAVKKLRAIKSAGYAPAVVKLVDFMKQLLGDNWSSNVATSMPSRLKPDEEAKKFEETFKDAVVYFNQFYKVYGKGVINRRVLWMAVARGTAIMCMDNQPGVDLIVPFLMRDEEVGRELVSAILIQVKNDASYGSTPHQDLFISMNPHFINVFDRDETETPPIVRMVFALASPKPGVKVTGLPSRRQAPRKVAPKKASRSPAFTSYDVWCARASRDTFPVISSDLIYDQLLKMEKIFPNAYAESPAEEAGRRSMHPMVFVDEAHFSALLPVEDNPAPNPLVSDADEEVVYDEGVFVDESDSD